MNRTQQEFGVRTLTLTIQLTYEGVLAMKRQRKLLKYYQYSVQQVACGGIHEWRTLVMFLLECIPYLLFLPPFFSICLYVRRVILIV